MPFHLEAKYSQSSYPRFWIGTWSLGGEGFGPVDGRESVRLLENALSSGFRHFDSAQFYAHGKSEAYLAKAIKQSGIKREEVFISSKGGLLWQGNQVIHNGSEKNLRQTLQQSLDTFKTDYLDLYQLHWPDPDTPIESSIEALKILQQEKLIRYWGVGNLTAQQVILYSENNSNIPHQVHHNPLHRNDAILSTGHQNNRCYNCIISPFEQGLLLRASFEAAIKQLGKKDVRRRNHYFTDTQHHRWLEQYYKLTKVLPFTRQEFLLLWQLQNSNVDAIILGPKTEQQLAKLVQPIKNLKEKDILDFKNQVIAVARKSGLDNQFFSDMFNA